ncbi:mannose/glucose-specific lectin-like [Phragmites australis]|uniref:mannose/glucose-specific lectin-like n=1 Tax=Phragmites australis TaxID=29695 RepID=UPI002D78A2C6|nr:mannose/glucose-specific lectin-like [Phragmites australis]
MAPRLSGAAVLLILVVVPLCMYTCAFLVGMELGRALERRPDSVSVRFSIRGVLDYVTKELWYTNGQGRDFVGDERHQFIRLVPASPRVGSSMRPEHPYGTTGDLKSNATPKAKRYHGNHTSPRGVISVGPWGGSGGQPFYMRGRSAPRLRSIIVYHSSVIHSLACEYSQAGDGVNWMGGPWGLPHSFGSRGVRATINLCAGEHVTAVEGTIGVFANVPNVVITSLTFRTNIGRSYGPYGSDKAAGTTGTPFSVPAADGACIVGFWGRSGWLLDAIGVYVRPCSNPTSARDGRN